MKREYRKHNAEQKYENHNKSSKNVKDKTTI